VCRSFDGEIEKYPWINVISDDSLLDPKELLTRRYLRGSVCGALFNREYLFKNSITFPVGVRNFEDTIFFLQCMYYCDKIRFKNIVLYHVVGMEGSASRTFDRNRLDMMVSSVRLIDERIKELPVIEDRFYIIQYMKYCVLSNLIYYTIKTAGVGYKYIKQANLKQFTSFTIDSNITFNRKKMLLMRSSITLFYFLAWLHSLISI
jgi:hypothetical protein